MPRVVVFQHDFVARAGGEPCTGRGSPLVTLTLP